MFDPRPVTLAVHPDLQNELKLRQQQLLDETGRRSKGGITAISEIAALELQLNRESSSFIYNSILKQFKNPQVITIEGTDYMPYVLYKKLFIYITILNKKKDTNQIVLEVFKPRGSKKNDVKILR